MGRARGQHQAISLAGFDAALGARRGCADGEDVHAARRAEAAAAVAKHGTPAQRLRALLPDALEAGLESYLQEAWAFWRVEERPGPEDVRERRDELAHALGVFLHARYRDEIEDGLRPRAVRALLGRDPQPRTADQHEQVAARFAEHFNRAVSHQYAVLGDEVAVTRITYLPDELPDIYGAAQREVLRDELADLAAADSGALLDRVMTPAERRNLEAQVPDHGYKEGVEELAARPAVWRKALEPWVQAGSYEQDTLRKHLALTLSAQLHSDHHSHEWDQAEADDIALREELSFGE